MRTPVQLLVEFGFPEADVLAANDDYGRVAAEVFPLLLERAREAGASEAVEKLSRPDLPSHEVKRLLYLAVRMARPDAAVETGTFNGTFTTFILLALRDNDHGRLVSLDLPATQPIPHAIDYPLPTGFGPGWIVPEALRGRLEIVLGDTRSTLPPVLDRLRTIDFFLHDSLHTTRHMLFEFRRVWTHLTPRGLLVSDDAFMSSAMWWFTRYHRIPLRHTRGMGVTQKPG